MKSVLNLSSTKIPQSVCKSLRIVDPSGTLIEDLKSFDQNSRQFLKSGDNRWVFSGFISSIVSDHVTPFMTQQMWATHERWTAEDTRDIPMVDLINDWKESVSVRCLIDFTYPLFAASLVRRLKELGHEPCILVFGANGEPILQDV